MKRQQQVEAWRMIRVVLVCLMIGVTAGWAGDAAKDFVGVLYDGPIREAVCMYEGAAVWSPMNRLGC